MKISFSLPDDPTAPTVARRVVRQALAELGVADDLIDDAVLATSELVTNAVEHGGGPDRLELEHDSEQFTLRVFDRSPSPPAQRTPGPAKARSRGLLLVQAVAVEWGSDPDGRGKGVWARFALRTPVES
ncbi:Anti-sigma regulatory factor (Ser/Thr protein kinase) [Amycolatopsis xylanica]|uniref:Anti-sigma regulatory factor (Ser/Thr protein kinase) n=1 Tax=Amycolatopsis xylanica TaxID=589385 RepID=A0A1H3T6H1_9PSEU|nr:ATP-binding protein [Amycolatopsis xylanica]SDZ44929.1 Anti-sigma regulatory factor (Ser/Thr protein kinase) [Amycolatopsis xylanica]